MRFSILRLFRIHEQIVEYVKNKFSINKEEPQRGEFSQASPERSLGLFCLDELV